MKRPGKREEPKISLIIPVYNEASCLERNVETIRTYLDITGWKYEMILVNDGSTDQTPAIIHQIAQRNRRVRLITYSNNRGKGYAIRLGMSHAKGKHALFTDADLAVPAPFLGTCVSKLEEGAPIVIGSRHLPDSCFKIREKPLRQLLGEIFRRLAQLSFRIHTSDITCGLKAFERKCADNIFSRSKLNRWGYDVEILFLAQKLGYHICEIPVHWYHSFSSTVSVGTDSARTLMEMFQIYRYYLHGRYQL